MRVILETSRLVLREMSRDDLPFITAMLTDEKVMAYWPRPYSPEECATWIERQMARYRDDRCGYWMATRKADGVPIGQVGLMKTEIDGHSRTALGYIIHFPFWRNGYAREASAACIAYAFEKLAKRRVVALVRPENGPSVAVARGLGMRPGRTVEYAGLAHVVFAISRGARPGFCRPSPGPRA